MRAGDPIDAVDREALALASLFGGLCLANAGLGAVHGFAAPLGGMFAAPHGAVCAALLPAVLRVNTRALAARAPDSTRPRALPRAGHDVDRARGRVDRRRRRLDRARCAGRCEVPGLSRYGMTAARIPELVAKARAASSMKGNPLPLTDAELVEIAAASL